MRTFYGLAVSTARALVLSIFLNIPLAMAAAPDDLYDRYFANVLAGTPCFARTYDEAYLKNHSAQRVRKIEIDLSKQNSDGTPNSADRFEIGFALMLTTSPDWYGQAARCKASKSDFECYLESDGGIFHLTPQNGGGLRLETSENGITLDSAGGDVEVSGKVVDNRLFNLAQSKEECESASAFFEGGSE